MGPRDLRGSMRTSVGEPDWELEHTDKEEKKKKIIKREDEVSLIREPSISDTGAKYLQ